MQCSMIHGQRDLAANITWTNTMEIVIYEKGSQVLLLKELLSWGNIIYNVERKGMTDGVCSHIKVI